MGCDNNRLRITRQGGHYYPDDFVTVVNGPYQARGKCVSRDGHNDELDAEAIHHSYISAMPLTICRTDLAVHEKLKGIIS